MFQIQIRNLVIIGLCLFGFLGIAYASIAPNEHDQKLIEYGRLEQSKIQAHNVAEDCRGKIETSTKQWSEIEEKQNKLWQELYNRPFPSGSNENVKKKS